MNELHIEGREIGTGRPAFVIAEIGVNHDGSAQRAIELARIARNCGADAVKLQVFRAHTLMHGSSAFADYQKQQCDDASPADMLRRYELDARALATVVDAIRDRGLVPLATPFSPSDVRTIEALGLPAIKIASPDIANPVLLRRAAQTGRPMIVSTGAATTDEVAEGLRVVQATRTPVALLHCVSSYPVLAHETNLAWIGELASTFRVPVGYSDHATDPFSGALAVAAGACIVEKHLTYDRSASGPDHSASADPAQFAEYVQLIRKASRMRGAGAKRVLACEQDVRTVSRQSLVLQRDVTAGERLSLDHLTVQRPGTGIPAAEVEEIVGRRVLRPLRSGTLLDRQMLGDAA